MCVNNYVDTKTLLMNSLKTKTDSWYIINYVMNEVSKRNIDLGTNTRAITVSKTDNTVSVSLHRYYDKINNILPKDYQIEFDNLEGKYMFADYLGYRGLTPKQFLTETLNHFPNGYDINVLINLSNTIAEYGFKVFDKYLNHIYNFNIYGADDIKVNKQTESLLSLYLYKDNKDIRHIYVRFEDNDLQIKTYEM